MIEKKRIVFTVSNDLVTDQRMIRLCTSLSEAGWQVTLVGRVKPNSPELTVQPYEQIRLKLPFHSGPLFYFFLNLALWRFLRKLPNTTVVGNVDLDTLPAGWLVRRNQPYRWWYEAHEYFPEVPELQDRLWIKKFWLTVEKRLVPRLKMVSTVSESVADHFRSLYPNLDVVVARNFPLLRQHNPLQPEEPRFLLYQGDLNEGRGLELAILAIEKFNDLHLYIAGDGYLRPRLEKLIGESSAANRIQLLGRILPQDLKAITDKAWVGLNLLENKGLNYYYSLANKYGDYLQAGLPQINMDFPEYRLLNQPQVSELLEEYSASALEKAITRLMNEDHYLKLRANAVLKRMNCCWELEAANLIRWFEAKVG